jgi:hypothetical protein
VYTVKARKGGTLDTACLFIYSDLKRNLTSAGEKLPVNRAVFLLFSGKSQFQIVTFALTELRENFRGLFSLSKRKQDRSFDILSSSLFTNHPIYFVTGNTGRSFNPLKVQRLCRSPPGLGIRNSISCLYTEFL